MSQLSKMSKIEASLRLGCKFLKGKPFCYRITGYFRSRNFRRTLDKLNFEGFIFELVAEFENILTRAILYAP